MKRRNATESFNPEQSTEEVVVGSVRIPVNPEPSSEFVPPEQVYVLPAQGYLEKLAYGVANNLPVLLIGETGVGKTLAVRYLAWKTNNGLRRVNLNGATTVDEFLGKLLINEQGTYWVNGVLVQAMLAGDWILLDEINATLPEIAFCLHSLLDDDRMVVLMEHDGRIVRPHPDFRLFASMNPSEEGRYGGTKTLNEALLDRFPVVIRMEYLGEEQEVEAVMAQSGNRDEEMVRRMVRAANDVRQAIRNGKVDGSFSTRRVIDWARMALRFGVRESATFAILNKLSSYDSELVEDVIDNYF
ncbi:MAG TPA: MoxR family ATPase [Anaerolineales bacterium]|nr:MoxR family ATPase [Anaerolineales bacterium]